jgi:hypothetical protein
MGDGASREILRSYVYSDQSLYGKDFDDTVFVDTTGLGSSSQSQPEGPDDILNRGGW